MGLLKICIAAGFLASVTPPSISATLTSDVSDEGKVIIILNGDIAPGDADQLHRLIEVANNSGRIVSGIRLNSPGGNFSEGVKLAEGIRFAKIASVIPNGSTCVSACFIGFAAGAEKFASYSASVGVHGASDQNGRETEGSNAVTVVMAKILNELGVSADIIGRMVVTPPDQMVWLSPDDLRTMGTTLTGKPPPPGFVEAVRHFNSLDVDAKATYQIMMTAAGYWRQIPRPDYSLQLFEDTKRFQSDLGHPAPGVLTEAEMDRLISLAIPNLRYWGFQQMQHPTRGHPIWVPMGIGGKIVPDKNGVRFEGSGVEIQYQYFPNAQLEGMFTMLLNMMIRDGNNILYRVMRKGFLVISAEKDGTNQYLRYHKDGGGLLGLVIRWQNNDAPLYGGRIMTLVSGSLSNQMLGTPMMPLPNHVIHGPWEDYQPRVKPPGG